MDNALARLFGGLRSKSDVEAAIDRLADALQDHLPERGVERSVDRFRHDGHAALRSIRSAGQDLKGRAGETLHERPGTSLALVLGFGILIGLLWSRR